MPPTEAPNWWADVQQDRDELDGRRPVDEWLDEDVEFVPARRFPRSPSGADNALHGVFVPARSEPKAVTYELVLGGDEVAEEPVIDAGLAELRAARVAEGSSATPVAGTDPAPVLEAATAGGRRTVHITGRPERAVALGGTARAARRPSRTASERLGSRPDRIAMWAVMLGAVLILLAAFSADSQAATAALLAGS